MSGDNTARWHCSVYPDLRSRTWEDEVFMFNPHTGHTHVLNALSYIIIQICAQKPVTESEVIALLSDNSESGWEPDSAGAVANHLGQLELLGLLARDVA